MYVANIFFTLYLRTIIRTSMFVIGTRIIISIVYEPIQRHYNFMLE